MKVIALKDGFYGRVMKAGEEFEVEDKVKGSWFKPVEGEAKEVKAPKAPNQANKKKQDGKEKEKPDQNVDEGQKSTSTKDK